MMETTHTYSNDLDYWRDLNSKTCEASSTIQLGAWSEWDKITDPDDDCE